MGAAPLFSELLARLQYDRVDFRGFTGREGSRGKTVISTRVIVESAREFRQKRRWGRPRLAVALLAIVSALALAACGSSSRSSSTTVSGTTSGSYSLAVKFSDCMRSHGVTTFPDPNPGGFSFPTIPGITQSPGFRSAQQACERFVPPPATSPGGFSPAQVARMQAQALALANCLRAHGVPDFPDPRFTSEPGGNFLPAFSSSTCKFNLSSPAFVAAVKVCPSGLGGSFALAFIRAQQEDGAACAQ